MHSQPAIIKKHFKTHKTLTNMQAFELYKILSVTSVISRLQKDFPLKKVWVSKVNKNGKKSRYAVWSVK